MDCQVIFQVYNEHTLQLNKLKVLHRTQLHLHNHSIKIKALVVDLDNRDTGMEVMDNKVNTLDILDNRNLIILIRIQSGRIWRSRSSWWTPSSTRTSWTWLQRLIIFHHVFENKQIKSYHHELLNFFLFLHFEYFTLADTMIFLISSFLPSLISLSQIH